MQIEKHQLYHVYNQGNNRGNIFFNRKNKLFFLQKVRKYIYPSCKIFAWCLMTNHFHFLIYTTAVSTKEKQIGSLTINLLSDGFRQLLSSYSQAINKQENRSGSLFRQKTKIVLLDRDSEDYPFICFQYIHQNPLRANLVSKMENWEFSSFRDYAGLRQGSLCDQSLARELLDFSTNNFYKESYQAIAIDKIEKLF